jgi:hypothetical protein
MWPAPVGGSTGNDAPQYGASYRAKLPDARRIAAEAPPAGVQCIREEFEGASL